MKTQPSTRRSHCAVCGKRLSVKTSTGRIKWQPSRIDDGGITCADCEAQRKTSRDRSKERREGRQ